MKHPNSVYKKLQEIMTEEECSLEPSVREKQEEDLINKLISESLKDFRKEKEEPTEPLEEPQEWWSAETKANIAKAYAERNDYRETPTEPSALDTQVGGNHYTEMGLQPFEITYANFGYKGIRASCYTKVNKYLVRDKDDHKGQLEKAIHVLQIQLEFLNREQGEC